MFLLMPVLLMTLAVTVWVGCGPGPESAPPEPREHEAGVDTPTDRTVPDPRVELESQGRFVYERNCQVCHGRWGDGRGEMAEGMLPRPGNLTRARFKFRSTPSGSLPTDDDLRRVITLGVAGSSMPAFSPLSDREVASVIAYLKTFSRRWDDSRLHGEPMTLPVPPEWISASESRVAHVRHGQELFFANCAACHGPAGRGDGPAAASLEDDAGHPAPPADLSTGLWKSGPTATDLFRSLSTGLDGTPMPSFAETLSAADRWDLVAFLQTLPRTP